MNPAPASLLDRLLGSGAVRGDVRSDVPLSGLGRWRIGGPADIVVSPSSRESLAEALRLIRESGVPLAVIGDGSNLLFDDTGFRGAILRIGRAFADLRIESEGRIFVGGGCWVPRLVRAAVGAGLAGLEHAIGIPGTVAGLCVMNGGSQRQAIGDSLVRIETIDLDGVSRLLDRSQLGLAYRRSILQDGRSIVLSAELQLRHGNASQLRRTAIDILAARRRKFPSNRANCGSVFVSDPDLYATIGPPGAAIERAGLKGARRGQARISPEHANFIVNEGGASSADVISLIALARTRVWEATGVKMATEVRYLHPEGGLRPVHDYLADPGGLGHPALETLL